VTKRTAAPTPRQAGAAPPGRRRDPPHRPAFLIRQRRPLPPARPKPDPRLPASWSRGRPPRRAARGRRRTRMGRTSWRRFSDPSPMLDRKRSPRRLIRRPPCPPPAAGRRLASKGPRARRRRQARRSRTPSPSGRWWWAGAMICRPWTCPRFLLSRQRRRRRQGSLFQSKSCPSSSVVLREKIVSNLPGKLSAGVT